VECPSCNKNYSFAEVPLEYRNMKALVTEFICPYCEAYLRPDKRFTILISVCYLLCFLSLGLFVVGFKFSSIVLYPAGFCMLMAVILFLNARSNLKLDWLDKEP